MKILKCERSFSKQRATLQYNVWVFLACCIQSFCDTDQFFCGINVTVQCEPLLCSSCCLPAGGSKSPLIPPVGETIDSGALLSAMTFRSRRACGPRLPFTFPIMQQCQSARGLKSCMSSATVSTPTDALLFQKVKSWKESDLCE